MIAPIRLAPSTCKSRLTAGIVSAQLVPATSMILTCFVTELPRLAWPLTEYNQNPRNRSVEQREHV